MEHIEDLTQSDSRRREVWTQTAPVLVDTLTPRVISPEDASWSRSLDLDAADALKDQFYARLEEANDASDRPTSELAVLWGGEAVQFNRIRRLVSEVGGDMAIGVVGEGVLRCRASRLAPRLRWLFDNFCQLDIFSLESPGGISVFADRKLPGWIELSIVGKRWVSLLDPLAAR